MIYKRISNKIKDWQLTTAYMALSTKTNFNPNEALIICGDPRGGSTWLAELIKQIPNTAMIWEPLAVSKVKEVEKLGFQWRQFIDETTEWEEAKLLFDQILSGGILSTYLCQRTTPQEIKSASRLLVKFCRANQLLPWLTQQFNFSYAPIYLVRHPCAVVASQMKQGGWSHVSGKFKNSDLCQPAYQQHQDFLLNIDSVEKKLAATWCLCNLVPLNHAQNNNKWITMTYESLLSNGITELKRVENRWGIPFPHTMYSQLLKSSTTTVSGSPIQEGKQADQLKHWQKVLSVKQVDKILSVLDYFKVGLYNQDAMPIKSFEN